MDHESINQQAIGQCAAILRAAIDNAVAEGALPGEPLPALTVTAADPDHADFASNIAMASAKALRLPPRKIAETLVSRMDFADTYIERAEIAGPGFINFFLRPVWYARALQSITACGEHFGRTGYGAGKKVMVEFVSANPTGPMHMGNARGGAIGDVLAAALDAAGYDVTREFYINDAGNQIEKFGVSLEARYLQLYQGEETVLMPEDGYQGEDIIDRAKEFAAIHGDKFVDSDSAARKKALVDYALPHNIEALRSDLATYRIEYDNWFHESSLYADGAVERVVDILTERGLTYKRDGALWYKATEYGGEKDEVLIRQNGNATYFAADIAYHYNKFAQRGFDTVIDVWGADHHGHVARLKGAMDAIGLDGGKLDIVLMQLVRLMKDGAPYKMSKRTGRSITLSDLLEMVPIDAARFLFNMREPNSTMDFDLDLAVAETSQNPVYYVQYANARICSVFKKAAEQNVAERDVAETELLMLREPEELALIRRLAELPDELIYAASHYDPARLTHYIIDVATLLHKFYDQKRCRILGIDNEPLMQARFRLCRCTRTVIVNAMGLLKIDVPERM